MGCRLKGKFWFGLFVCSQRAIVGEFGLPYKAVTGAELEVIVSFRVYTLSLLSLNIPGLWCLFFLFGGLVSQNPSNYEVMKLIFDHLQSLKERLGQVVRSLGEKSPNGNDRIKSQIPFLSLNSGVCPRPACDDVII